MVGELHGFWWEVPTTGFRWVRGEPVKKKDRREGRVTDRLRAWGVEPDLDWYLVMNPAEGRRPDVRPYDALSVEPALFRTFAGTEPSRKGILRFANRYGWLKSGTGIRAKEPEERARFGGALIGEGLETWRGHIRLVSELVHLWDLYDRGDERELSRHIRWNDSKDGVDYCGRPDDKRPAYIPGRAKSLTQLPEAIARNREPVVSEEVFKRLTPGEVLLPAIIYLQRRINEQLDVKSFPRLLWDQDGQLRLRPPPGDLINMLWLQFADTVSGKASYRACLSCGRWVRVGPDAARTSRLYCSNACRTRGLRQRQQTARALHAQGKSIEAIAEELDSDVPTVTKWVAGGQEGVD